MLGFKERTIEIGGRAEAYYNLHKHTFSMKQGGLVVLHSNFILLEDATFHVSEAGRQRVLQEQRKNVHATVRGRYHYFEGLESVLDDTYREAYYNPYKVSTFVDKETGEPLHAAATVILKDKKIFYKMG